MRLSLHIAPWAEHSRACSSNQFVGAVSMAASSKERMPGSADEICLHRPAQVRSHGFVIGVQQSAGLLCVEADSGTLRMPCRC